jgi:endonuclease-3 related protein
MTTPADIIVPNPMTDTLEEVYQRLLAAYGPQHWWPAASPFEVLIGAVLVQNTSWQNVARAIDNLQQEDLLDPHALYDLSAEELEERIRPAGYFRVKTRRLRNLLELLVARYDGSLEAMFATGPDALRAELLGINGVGPETADSILLYAGGVPTFVVDAYTRRVFARHGWIDFDADYDTIRDHFESGLERDAALYNEYHALLVRLGKLHCRKKPKCDGCPLADLLPEGGPRERKD